MENADLVQESGTENSKRIVPGGRVQEPLFVLYGESRLKYTGGVKTTSPPAQWLASPEVKLPQYALAFRRNDVDGSLLFELDGAALGELGVTSSLHAIKITNRARRQYLHGATATQQEMLEEGAAVTLQAALRGRAERQRWQARAVRFRAVQ
jgi:hypothetical protein